MGCSGFSLNNSQSKDSFSPPPSKGASGYNDMARYVPIPLNKAAAGVSAVFKNQTIPPRDSEEKFTDDVFPPNNNSVFGLDSKGNPIDKFEERTGLYKTYFAVKPEEIVWLSAEEIFDGDFKVFENSVHIDDVKQGKIGDCYFLSSCASMSTSPQLILQLFRTWEKPKNGCYEVILRINGIWKVILLDDMFPCYKNTKKPIFSRPNHKEIWSMLLEKAWAKVNGGYININGGLSTEAMFAMTPFQTVTFYHVDTCVNQDTLWEILKIAKNKRYIMSCVSKDNDEVKKIGLISSHSFSIIDAKEAEINGKQIRLVKVRNPWGYKNWKGDWCDDSSLWTEEAKKVFDIESNLIKGTFWVKFEDFFNCFTKTEICKVKYIDCSICYKIPKERMEFPNVFEVRVYSETKLNLTVIKKSYRFNRKIPPNAEMQINVVLVKKADYLTYIASESASTTNPNFEVQLKRGDYLIYIHAITQGMKMDKKRSYNFIIGGNCFFSSRFVGMDQSFDLLSQIISDDIKYSTNTIPEKIFIINEKKYHNTSYCFFYMKVNNIGKTICVEFQGEFSNVTRLTKIEKEMRLASGSEILFLGCEETPDKEVVFMISTNFVQDEGKGAAVKKSKKDLSLFMDRFNYPYPNSNMFDFVYKKLVFTFSDFGKYLVRRSVAQIDISNQKQT